MRRRGKVGLHHQRGQASSADREIRKCADYDGRGFSGNAGEGTEEVNTPQDHVPVYSRLVKRRSKGVQKLLKPHKLRCLVACRRSGIHPWGVAERARGSEAKRPHCRSKISCKRLSVKNCAMLASRLGS